MSATTKTSKALVTAQLNLTKETKGAYRYDTTEAQAAAAGGPLNIYVRKDQLNGQPAPATIKITIEAA